MIWALLPHPVIVDKQSIQLYEGANAKLHFPMLQGGGVTRKKKP